MRRTIIECDFCGREMHWSDITFFKIHRWYFAYGCTCRERKRVYICGDCIKKLKELLREGVTDDD